MKKQLLFFIFLIIINSTSFSFDIAQKFSNTIVPLSDISVDRLWRAQRDDCSIEDFHYQQEIWKREDQYEETLSDNISKNDSLVGDWYLTDSKNVIVEKNRIAPIQFTLTPNGISYRKQSSTSYVYEIEKDSYLIIPTWDAGMIRLLKIFNDKLYIYNLDGDTWYLDDIHKSGNYYKRY